MGLGGLPTLLEGLGGATTLLLGFGGTAGAEGFGGVPVPTGGLGPGAEGVGLTEIAHDFEL